MSMCGKELNNSPIFLLKFTNELSRLKSLEKGNLYMNTLNFFKELERETGEKGMADSDEGSMILNSLHLKVFEHGTDKLVHEISADKAAMTVKEHLRKHIFCMVYLTKEDLQVIEENSNSIKVTFSFTESQKKDFETHFGKHVMVIPFGNFAEKLRTGFEKENIQWIAGRAKYRDFTINHKDRIEEFINNSDEQYFWKDHLLEWQKEYRVVVLNKGSDNPVTLNIGDLSNCSFITTTEKLFSKNLILEISNSEK